MCGSPLLPGCKTARRRLIQDGSGVVPVLLIAARKGSSPETEYGSDDASKLGGEPGGVLPPNARVGSVFDRNLSSLMKPATEWQHG